MSDREKELLKEIEKILGYNPREAIEVMLENLEKGILMIPHITLDQREKINEVKKQFLRDKPFEGVGNLRMTFTVPELRIQDVEENKIEEEEEDKEVSEYGGNMTSLDYYDEEADECRDIFIDRNEIYKDAFEELGLIGTVSTLLGDCQRLKNMIYKQPDHGRKYTEQIEDKLMDIVNQALISLIMLHKENFEGK